MFEHEIDDYQEEFFDDESYVQDKTRPTTLNLKDYNLNSPLLKDLNEKVCLFYNAKIRSTGNYKLDEFVSKTRNDIKNWDQNHHWLSEKLFYKDGVDLSWFDCIWNQTHHDANESIELINDFLMHFDLPIKERHQKKISFREIRYWGQLFMETMILTILINNIDKPFSINLLKGIEKQEKIKRRKNKLYSFPIIGDVEISENGIINDSHFLCKNFVLMVKDITAARVFSVSAMIDRLDNAMSDYEISQMIEIWVEGDKLINSYGNSSYDCIKLIEPIANNDLIKSAQKIRPEISIKSEFEEFVEQEIQKYEVKGIYFPRLISIKLEAIDNLEFKLAVYGCFRTWGHPYINFEEGLEKLYEQVTHKKVIDDSLAQALASDLAFKVLEKKFNEERKWMVDKEKVSKNDPLWEYITKDMWPPVKVLSDYGDNFHKLPLIKCYEIPDFIDPTLIYSDKAHSVTKDELIADILEGRQGPCRTKRVLDTLIHTDFTYWKNFLQEINDNGLEDKWLLIGLKAKERELKIIGRYFALLSWKLREYFVITEYLIKIHFIKLYDGLTMADDLKGVITKLINRTMHQGTTSYESITIANHIDYSKWNNHQRMESNKYVFRVMGQFMGYPKLFERTHEFFQKSLIYYAGDKSLLTISEGKVVNSTSLRACWDGQAGGLEGLRQKGWSLLNIILLERIARKRNTKIKLLAQGDNQVVCTSFKLTSIRDDQRAKHIKEVLEQNRKIMEDIKIGTAGLGLIINQEETMVSTEYLNYGKVPVYRGNICGLKMKRWARVNCFSNDNLPNLSNVISTVSSTALSVSHFSMSFIDPMYNYNFFGCLAKNLLKIFNPCLGTSIKFKRARIISTIKTLYLDPSIGGVCGMNLNRFLIRNFPDPITESLSFWNIIYKSTRNPIIKMIACNAGNPKVSFGIRDDFRSLLEDPTSINIARGLSPLTMLRNEIRTNMLANAGEIKNSIIKDITLMGEAEEDQLLTFIMSIKPLFPRFASQLKSSTACGIRDSIVGMYENSRTIRKYFLDSMRDDFDEQVIKSELKAIEKLEELWEITYMGWSCSASQADILRRMSWGQDIVGMTIPHPSEIFSTPQNKNNCSCVDNGDSIYLTTIVDFDNQDIYEKRGNIIPYLGSTTSEGTSITTPWEKDSKVPFIKRVLKIKNSINWFVQPNTKLSRSIHNMILSITGQEFEDRDTGYRRTGSAIHRFSTERQSSGGYNAITPAILTRMFTTTDTMGELNSINLDLMYQSCIIAMQSLLSRPSGYLKLGKNIYHSHINCKDCLREVKEIYLESDYEFKPRSLFHVIEKWIPTISGEWIERTPKTYPIVESMQFSYEDLNFHIGATTGFAYCEMMVKGEDIESCSRLFPNSIGSKVEPENYLKGIMQGLINCSTLNSLSRRSLNTLKDPFTSVGGNVITALNNLTSNIQFLTLCKGKNIMNYLLTQPHKVPSSYPLSNTDQALIVKSVLRTVLMERLLDKRVKNNKILLFSDIIGTDLEMTIQLGSEAYNVLISSFNRKTKLEKLRKLKDYNIEIRDKTKSKPTIVIDIPVLMMSQEIRHVLKFYNRPIITDYPKISFGLECSGYVIDTIITYRYEKSSSFSIQVPQKSNPLISGLRLFQLATGAHYKLRCLLNNFQIKYNYFLCGGDGSGGMTSALLRYQTTSRGVFNSLLELSNTPLRGSKPAPPSAIDALGMDRSRCLNIDDCWENPSDLSLQSTWEYFKQFVRKNKFDLMVFDMEIRDQEMMDRIIENLDYYMDTLISRESTIIFKTYLDSIINNDKSPLSMISSWFKEVHVCQTEFTSSHSSEVYVVGRKLNKLRETKFIDGDSLQKIINKNFVFRTSEQEFIRAKQIRSKDLYAGVHYTLRTPLEVELELLFNSAGVPNGISHRLSNELVHIDISNVDLKWMLIRIIDHFCFNTMVPMKSLLLPSDQVLKDTISIFLGIMFSLSLDYNYDRQNVFMEIINKGICISIKNHSKDPNEYLNSWVVSPKGKYVNIRSKMALIGSAIRVCERLGSRLKVNKIELNKHWITKDLFKTGIPYLWETPVWDFSYVDNIQEMCDDLFDVNMQEMSYDLD
ncbi:polymerase [Sandjimba virus]|uniref:RNA-directed RNA polymerase L n=3 Tax=Sandjimba virus TaxID=380432 RepID=A0AAE9BMS6_9RHAB|nr:polymerase [Sandjimba virus]UAU42858.1 polymerase [Sandjimba virus]